MTRTTIPDHLDELAALRRDLHSHPEISFDLYRTSGIVARQLERYGFHVTTGIAETGVVGTLTNGAGRKSIGIRADMDALPIHETTNLPHASKTPGKMHACGHDGHTAMLLGAARHLAQTRNFDGTVHVIFQPAEEVAFGGLRMVEEGLFKRFPCDAVFALHNIPGAPVGHIMVRPGPITASIDIAMVKVHGIGGHGAMPHQTADPIVAAAGIVLALQTVVSRNVDPTEAAAVTVGSFHAGVMATIIPDLAEMEIGIRCCTDAVRALLNERIPKLIQAQAKSYGCEAEIAIERGYPSGVNDEAAAALVAEVAGQLGPVTDMRAPFMFAEDFAYMLEAVPGCYFGLGNGASRSLHDPGYDFNDENLIHGPAIWGRLVERFLSAP